MNKKKYTISIKSKDPLKKTMKIMLLITFLSITIFYTYFADKPIIQQRKKLDKIEVFSDTNGKPILAMGICNENFDCMPTGCSSQICSDHNVTTSCELGEFPEKETFTCGCQNGKCVWYRFK